MRYSMMSYTMARQGATPEEIISATQELGLSDIDWVTTYGRDPKELKKMSLDAGLNICCYTFFIPKLINREKGGLDEVKHSIETAVELGSPLVMVPSPPPGNVTSREESRLRWIDAMYLCSEFCVDAGLVLTIENFPGKLSPMVTADDFFEFKKAIPSIKLTFDNGNAFTGEDPAESLRRTIADVVHVHLKDWDLMSNDEGCIKGLIPGRSYTPALIGEGVVDSLETVRILRENGYRGCINIEYENSKYPAKEAIRKVLEHLKTA